jgi:hypothetical protein
MTTMSGPLEYAARMQELNSEIIESLRPIFDQLTVLDDDTIPDTAVLTIEIEWGAARRLRDLCRQAYRERHIHDGGD